MLQNFSTPKNGLIHTSSFPVHMLKSLPNRYQCRGIPHRRGYLLHGKPGAGKSSTIFALASELGLDIYPISLSQGDMDDSSLNQLLLSTKNPSIILIEDIDVAFSRDAEDEKTDKSPKDSKEAGLQKLKGSKSESQITLSGLLNAIDGVSAPEGRILIATTNSIERLDDALLRPGRLDVRLYYGFATEKGNRQLFYNFYFGNAMSLKKSSADKVKEVLNKAPKFAPKTLKEADIDASGHNMFEYSETEVLGWAEAFASQIPDSEFTVAQVQGWLMNHKHNPQLAVDSVPDMIRDERRRAQDKAEREEELLRKSIAKEAALEAKKKVGKRA